MCTQSYEDEKKEMETERKEREALIKQQDLAYQESLRIDQNKVWKKCVCVQCVVAISDTIIPTLGERQGWISRSGGSGGRTCDVERAEWGIMVINVIGGIGQFYLY